MSSNLRAVTNESFATVVSAAGAEAEFIPENVSTLSIVKKFFITGAPLTLATVSQFSIITVILAVIGRYEGVNELGGAALALGLLNATAFAFAAGSCGALETVLSHTYGMNQARTGGKGAMHMYGTYTQRMAIILFVLSIPIGCLVIYIDVFLEYIGQTPEVVYFTGRFCRLAAFGIPSTQMFQLIGRYYTCQHVTTPLSVAMVAASLLNPVLQVIFIQIFGFDGSPVAWMMLFTLVDAALLGYAYKSGFYKQTWNGWDSNALKNIKGMVKLAVPSMAMMMSEWVVLEVISVCAGFAEPHELAAFSISMQVFGLCWAIASGTIIIVCVFIGNVIGEGKPLLGKRIANVAIMLAVTTATIDVILCWLLEDHIPSFFTTDERVTPVYRRLMRFVLPYHMVDTFQSTVMGILRGCGLQKTGAIIIGVALCVIGAPVAFFLFFYLHYGVESLWIGPFSGVALFGAPCYIYLLYWHIDWPNLKPHQEDAHNLPAEIVEEELGEEAEEEDVVVEGERDKIADNGTKDGEAASLPMDPPPGRE
ncbi:putative membrane transporter protein [Trypanosoma grayi]|uniref:putative membrane transporter protein n=1 Tax=Trypanosoma grayi TaxID=71804 RepID=UPI0004F49C03|nr:putative membrane transporter protein [Trypanosoma grayi]KEG15037.1 putative membrane transporter protein [Trypanosoma grayi]